VQCCFLSFTKHVLLSGSSVAAHQHDAHSQVCVTSRLYIKEPASDNNTLISEWPNPIYVSPQVKDRKSTFMAHSTRMTSSDDVPEFLDHLKQLPAVKRATHCMYAYRVVPETTGVATLVGQNDGGESGSGDRLSRLLELSGCKNVIVVVSRWYGGVQLGSDRWKWISLVAKDALKEGGFFIVDESKSKSSLNKKRSK